ncbi:MAG: type III-B CRISPR module-associated Cmr3 family protein [Verrucomicrobiia bacterium]
MNTTEINKKEIVRTKFIEPSDVLFFRDAIPMGAGVGKGAGSRLPFPTTLHEAFRASLLINTGKATSGKSITGRPKEAIRKGNWHEMEKDSQVKIAAREFRSLNIIGPFPYLNGEGLLLPVPKDVAVQKTEKKGNQKSENFIILHRMELFWDKNQTFNRNQATDAVLRCLPVGTLPPSKESELKGYFSIEQYKKYLSGSTEPMLDAKAESELWQPEYRIGVQIDPETFASMKGQIYAATYMRPERNFQFVCQLILKDPRNGEADALDKLDWLLFGGEHRLARLINADSKNPFADDLFKEPVAPQKEGPVLLKWVLATPAIFANGSLPGWCFANRDKNLPPGFVALNITGKCALISWCLGRPLTVSGFDVVDWKAKDTLLAVPAGSVYYFLCENHDAANELANALHWKPRSDYYGEKGCGYGFVSFDVRMHPASGDVTELANQLFKQ